MKTKLYTILKYGLENKSLFSLPNVIPLSSFFSAFITDSVQKLVTI